MCEESMGTMIACGGREGLEVDELALLLAPARGGEEFGIGGAGEVVGFAIGGAE
jgi:hypothetical protein